MARPILPTPTLVGREAEEFWHQIATYKDYLKERGIVLDYQEMKKDADFLESLKKKNNIRKK